MKARIKSDRKWHVFDRNDFREYSCGHFFDDLLETLGVDIPKGKKVNSVTVYIDSYDDLAFDED